jgi:sugar O-acyltransferase (sialic acid O-acetyltransferase NeuD family)
MKKRAFVVGAGGHGKVVVDTLLSAGDCEIVGFIDDDAQKLGKLVFGIPVVGSFDDLLPLAAQYHIDGTALAIGDNYVREHQYRRLKKAGLDVLRVVHPRAYISRFACLGDAVVIFADSVINPGAVIGDNVCVNTRASVDHDTCLGYSCHVFANATLTGGVVVGDFSYIGCSATVIPNRQIGRFSFVGAGAVVIRDVGEGVKVAGVPAREIGSQIARPLQLKLEIAESGRPSDLTART